MQTVLKLLVVMALCVPIFLLSVAQNKSRQPNEVQVEKPQFDPLELPAGEDAWIIRFDSYGGASGNDGSGIINSQGDIYTTYFYCSPVNCRSQMSTEELQELSQQISLLKQSAWEARYPAAPPSHTDLKYYKITLLRRTSDGSEQVYTTQSSSYNRNHLRIDIAALYGKIYRAMHGVHLICRKCGPPPINQGPISPPVTDQFRSPDSNNLGPMGPSHGPVKVSPVGPPPGSPQHRTQTPVTPH